MYRRYLIVSVSIMLIISSLAFAEVIDKIAVFYESVGWIAADPAKKAGDAIVTAVAGKVNDVKVYNDADIGKFAKDNTNDGDVDLIITFGYFPVSLYTPGNAQADGSVGELFLEGGNMILNTADYIFYVTQGGGANGDTGLKNMTDSNFDLWTDGNTTVPTAAGLKYAPSLPKSITAPRAFVLAQIADDPDWEVEIAFAENADGTMADPVIIRNKTYGGRVGIVLQVSDDGLARDKIMPEIVKNYITDPTAVKPADKTTTTWGQIKND